MKIDELKQILFKITGLFDTSMSPLEKQKEIGTFETEEIAQRELLEFKKKFIIKYTRRNRNKVSRKMYEAMIKWEIEIAVCHLI